MRIGIPAETRPGETRVAATPETVKKMAQGGGHTIVIQAGAGTKANYPDADYAAAGGTLVASAADVFAQADIVLKVRGPEPDELAMLRPGVILACLLSAFDPEHLQALARTGGHGLSPGVDSAHHARADDGRAVLPGKHRRLQGRHRRG